MRPKIFDLALKKDKGKIKKIEKKIEKTYVRSSTVRVPVWSTWLCLNPRATGPNWSNAAFTASMSRAVAHPGTSRSNRVSKLSTGRRLTGMWGVRMSIGVGISRAKNRIRRRRWKKEKSRQTMRTVSECIRPQMGGTYFR